MSSPDPVLQEAASLAQTEAYHQTGAYPQAEAPAQPALEEVVQLEGMFHAGRHAEAVALAQGMTQRYPGHWVGWKMLGVVLSQGKRYAEALGPMQEAAALLPDDAEVHNNLGIVLNELERREEAENSYRRALQLNPEYAQAHSNLGVVLQAQGRLEEAAACYRRALQLKPDYVRACINLGAVLDELQQPDEAEDVCRQALQIVPDCAELLTNLGLLLKKRGDSSAAEACYWQAIQADAGYAEALFNLGDLKQTQGLPDDAQACFLRAVEIKPDYVAALVRLAIVLQDKGRKDEAEVYCRRAYELKPDIADTMMVLSLILQEMSHLDEAETLCQRALSLCPGNGAWFSSLGCIQQKKGNLSGAMLNLRRALEMNPQGSEAHSNLIFTLDMMEEMGTQELQAERRCWDRMHGQGLRQSEGYANSREAGRRLRIGYVSADFRDHSAAKVFGGMLMAYDREQFEVYAYSNHARKEDWLSERLKQNVSVWRDVHALTDEELAERIRGDGIDILVDLSGYTAGNRLLVFARKPAPIQISAWGYATSTGLSAMDVFFTDEVMVPPQEREYYTEEVRYLPSVVGYCPFEPYPDVNALPALTTGRITFGSFNRLAKATEATYRAWVEILRAVPGSRLLLKTVELRDEAVRAGVLERFLRAGIEAERIVLHGNTTWRGHVGMFNEVDIALDPFPHGGGVTALEGLMMGVPLVTLRWPTVVGRLSASIMTTLGMQDWIAESVEAYVRLACAKAGDVGGLAELRSGLRGRFMGTVLGDQAAYARAVEQEYRSLWTRWCA